MDKNNLLRKSLVVAVIVLFIGVAVAPSMSAIDLKTRNLSKETLLKRDFQDDDLVEVTVSLCKIDGIENHTVMLTKEQADELDVLIDNFKAELDNAETLEETVALYCDMIESLDELGLIPDDMTIEETQQLVTGNNYAPKEKQEEMITLLNKAAVKSDDMGILSDDMNSEKPVNMVTGGHYDSDIFEEIDIGDNWGSNIMCLVAGAGAGETVPVFVGLLVLIMFLLDNSLANLIYFLNPFSVLNVVVFFSTWPWPWWIPPPHGWIKVIGLRGSQNFNGYIEGFIIGFTGIRLIFPIDKNILYWCLLGFGIYTNFEIVYPPK